MYQAWKFKDWWIQVTQKVSGCKSLPQYIWLVFNVFSVLTNYVCQITQPWRICTRAWWRLSMRDSRDLVLCDVDWSLWYCFFCHMLNNHCDNTLSYQTILILLSEFNIIKGEMFQSLFTIDVIDFYDFFCLIQIISLIQST